MKEREKEPKIDGEIIFTSKSKEKEELKINVIIIIKCFSSICYIENKFSNHAHDCMSSQNLDSNLDISRCSHRCLSYI